MTIWFSSDFHFDHKNIIQYCNRPFSDVTQMNLAMVERWNSKVLDSDTVYFLGDFTLGGVSSFLEWYSKLNGIIYIIEGNHDRRWWNKVTAENSKVLTLAPIVEIEIEKQKIVLSHYPIADWNGRFHGVWHLFGHSHGNTKGIGKSFDVGVDCWNFYPISFQDVKAVMEKITDE